MKKLTTPQWVNKAITTHGTKYDYSGTVYVNSDTPVNIICPIHGMFTQRPLDHVAGRGCNECSGVKRWSTQEFIQRANEVHNNKYDYSKSEYTGVYQKTTIICPIHGEFKQTPGDHVNKKCNCPICVKLANDIAETKTTEQFIKDAIAVHGDRYDYSQSIYTHSHNKLKIICKKHGLFEQTPNEHTNAGCGCQLCAATYYVSKGEMDIATWLNSIGITNIVYNSRKVIYPYELDILIPSHNIAIEYCGVYWHSEQQGKDRNYHANKHKLCQQQGIQLITIFEDEWKYNKQQIKNKISHLLGVSRDNTIYARKCFISCVSSEEKREFLDKHHIQQNGAGSVTYGLKYNNELVAVMTFIKKDVNIYELNRYATSCNIPGGFSKLLKHFQSHNEWKRIVSFADLRWSDGNLYFTNGWTHEDDIPPDYMYISKGRRVHKFNYRRKYLAAKLDKFDPSLSEWQNCKNNGVLRVWDCGKMRFVIENKHYQSTID